jgi:hypothetical protein
MKIKSRTRSYNIDWHLTTFRRNVLPPHSASKSLIRVKGEAKPSSETSIIIYQSKCCRLHLKRDGTRAETRFRLSEKPTVHLNRRGRQFRRLLAAEVCASAVVMLDTPCSEVVWRVLATHSVRQFTLHFPSRASSCVIRFQTHSNTSKS